MVLNNGPMYKYFTVSPSLYIDVFVAGAIFNVGYANVILIMNDK